MRARWFITGFLCCYAICGFIFAALVNKQLNDVSQSAMYGAAWPRVAYRLFTEVNWPRP